MAHNEIKRIEKDDYLTIKEFAEIVGIPAYKLRFYDRRGILVPVKRGKDKDNSYRYYSPKQITAAKMIKLLRQIGVELEEIATLEKDRSPEAIMKLIARNKRRVLYDIHTLQENYSVMSAYHDLIIEGISADENEISVCEMEEISIMLGEPTDFTRGEGYYNELLRFCKAPRSPKANPSFPVGGYFDNIETFTEHPSKPDRFYSLDPDGRQCREKGLYLVGHTRGYHSESNELLERMVEYAKQNKIAFDGPVYSIYLFDEICMLDTSQYLLQVAASIKSFEYRLTSLPYQRLQNES